LKDNNLYIFMSQHPKKIGVIISSSRPGRSADKIVAWLMPAIEKYAEEVKAASGASGTPVVFEVIDLQAWALPFLNEPGYPSMGKNYQHDHSKKWSAKIDECSGFIILANEYNHGYSAVLKNALDYLYLEWNNKPVSFISYGGVAGGSRSVEQLRQVVVELQMIPLREQVIIALSDFFAENNQASLKRWEEQVAKVVKQIIARV
jgi:NAD(P)H-dependent FMN reductase